MRLPGVGRAARDTPACSFRNENCLQSQTTGSLKPLPHFLSFPQITRERLLQLLLQRLDLTINKVPVLFRAGLQFLLQLGIARLIVVEALLELGV